MRNLTYKHDFFVFDRMIFTFMYLTHTKTKMENKNQGG